MAGQQLEGFEMNNSSSGEYGFGLEQDSEVDRIAYNFFLGIGAVIIVIENSALVALVASKRKLRTYTNGLCVSLAVSDLLVGGALIPMVLASAPASFFTYIIAIILYSNVTNITAVAIERYCSIIRPLHYEVLMDKYFIKLLVISWTLPVVVAFLPLCWGNDPDSVASIVYLICLFALGTVIPYIALICIYQKIFREVGRQRVLIQKQSQCCSFLGKKIQVEGKVSKIFVTIAVIFVLSWAPVTYMTVVEKIFDRPDLVPNSLSNVVPFLIELSSSVNAILYAFYKSDFREALWELHTRARVAVRRCCHGQESPPLSSPPAQRAPRLYSASSVVFKYGASILASKEDQHTGEKTPSNTQEVSVEK